MGLLNLFKRTKPIDLVALQRDLDIVNDCAELMENTVNPETFSVGMIYIWKSSLYWLRHKHRIK